MANIRFITTRYKVQPGCSKGVGHRWTEGIRLEPDKKKCRLVHPRCPHSMLMRQGGPLSVGDQHRDQYEDHEPDITHVKERYDCMQRDHKHSKTSLLLVMSCALDRISSYTVSLLKRHYSIDDVLSRVSFPRRRYQPHSDLTDSRSNTLQRMAVKPLPLLSFSNGKGYMAFAQCHRNKEDEGKGEAGG